MSFSLTLSRQALIYVLWPIQAEGNKQEALQYWKQHYNLMQRFSQRTAAIRMPCLETPDLEVVAHTTYAQCHIKPDIDAFAPRTPP